MSSTSKIRLGYEIKSNDEVLSYEEEMNYTVFNCTEEDFIDKPLYSRFSKTDSYKGGPQKPKISDSDDKSNEHSTCQSNDNEGSFRNPSEHSSESESKSISVLKEMSTSKSVTINEKVVSELKEVEPSCVTHVKTPRQPMKNPETHKVNGKNWDDMMEKKLREVQLIAVRANVNSVRRNVNSVRQNVNSVRPNVNTGRANVNSVRQNVNSVRSNVNTGSFNINTVKAKQPINNH
ncbi:hypothetical protein Tco_1329790 [Tanacetum coccineum]